MTDQFGPNLIATAPIGDVGRNDVTKQVRPTASIASSSHNLIRIFVIVP